MKKLERLPEVCARVGLSPATVWRAVKGGSFPAPVRISTNAVAWVSDDVDRWVDERIAASRGAA